MPVLFRMILMEEKKRIHKLGINTPPDVAELALAYVLYITPENGIFKAES
jgi:hypothetical protein